MAKKAVRVKKVSVASVIEEIQILLNKSTDSVIRMKDLNLSGPNLNLFYNPKDTTITGFVRFVLYEYDTYDVFELAAKTELFMEAFRILLGADALECSHTGINVSREWDDIDIFYDVHFALREGVYWEKIVNAYNIEREREKAEKREAAKKRREKDAAELKRKESEEYELFLSLKEKFEVE